MLCRNCYSTVAYRVLDEMKDNACLAREPVVDDGKETPTREAQPKASTSSPGWAAARKAVRIIVGVILMVLGLAALFTPLTPGSWLIPIGLEFLGLRVLLRNRVCAWAGARPQSRFRRTMCRVLSLDGLDALKRRWQRHRGKA